MHMVSKKDLDPAEMETMRTSSPTTVVTANGEVQTREEAIVYVKELDLFVTVMLLEETLAVLSLGKLCEDHEYTYHWISGQKPHLIRNSKRIDCNISNYVPFIVPGLSTSSSTTPHLHHHLHHRIPHLTKADTPKIQYPKEVEVRVRSYRENPMHKPTETENKNKNEGREELQSDLSHELLDWWKEVLSNKNEIIILGPETEIMKETP